MEDRDVIPVGEHLENKNVALLITSGIAAVKANSWIRHFRQYGANVQVYATEESKKFIAELPLEWNSLNPVIYDLTANAEHVQGGYDAYVVAPATMNTINKMAQGIADNAVSSTLASALGRLQQGETSVLIAPTMHGTLKANPIYQSSLRVLQSFGVAVISPREGQGKENIPPTHQIVARTIREISDSPLKGKRVMITAGPTPGKIDNVRLLTNRFGGRLGVAIAEEAYLRGADVDLVLGPGKAQPPFPNDVFGDFYTYRIRDFEEYYELALDMAENHDVGIFSAAVADYIPKTVLPGKTPSQGALKAIELKETPKVIKEVREQASELFMVTFKYEERKTEEELLEIARNRIDHGYNMVVANRGEEMSQGEQKAYIMDFTREVIATTSGSKISNARTILDCLEQQLAEE